MFGGGERRLRWADVVDSSQENADTVEDARPTPISQSSYRGVSQESLEDVRALPDRLRQAAALNPARQGAAGDAAASGRAASSRLAPPSPPRAAQGGAGAPAEAAGAAAEEVAAAPADAAAEAATISQRLRGWRPAQGAAAGATPPRGPAPAPAALGAVATPRTPGRGGAGATPFTPSRRRSRQRYDSQLGAQTPGSKRLRSAALAQDGGAAWSIPEAPMPEAAEVSEEDWQRRHRKRHTAIQSIKTSPEYAKLAMLRATGTDDLPLTPDAENPAISKRKWEASVMHWRNGLKSLLQGPGQDAELIA